MVVAIRLHTCSILLFLFGVITVLMFALLVVRFQANNFNETPILKKTTNGFSTDKITIFCMILTAKKSIKTKVGLFFSVAWELKFLI